MKTINNKKKKKENKIKRKISIFTVMLWLFLVTTITTVVVSSTKKTNALEVDDENWNISLVMYDRSSDMPNKGITEFTWNAEKGNETKELVMQINYACTTNKGYKPGEIELTIPGISKDSFSEYWRNYEEYYSGEYLEFYDYFLNNNIAISADKYIDVNKKYDFTYIYDKENNIYTFTNNKEITENEHFEGSIQIVYNLEPKFKIETNLEYRAKIKEDIKGAEEIITKESNICSFNYTSIKKDYSLSLGTNVAPQMDYTKIEDILDNYYWVRYHFSPDSSLDNVILAYGEDNLSIDNANNRGKEGNCIKEELPEECVLYDNNLKKVEPRENNTYYYLKGNEYYYVGYPKSKYNIGDSVTNTAELWGRYEDEEKIQKLADVSKTVILKEFDFEYTGKLYNITKKSKIEEKLYKNNINMKFCDWLMKAIAFNTGDKMDVEIGDDILYITRENGEVTRLNDDEYYFNYINIPVFYTYDENSKKKGEALIGYDYEVQIRGKETNEYVTYETGVTENKKREIVFYTGEVQGIKIIIKDLDKTLYDGELEVSLRIYPKDCDAGALYNFNYLQVYNKDSDGNRILANEVESDSYSTPSTLKIAEYDMDTYERYLQRSYGRKEIEDGEFELNTSKTSRIKNNNVENEKYEVEYSIYSDLYINYYEVDKDCIIKQYDILPLGVNLSSNKEDIINSIKSKDILPFRDLSLKDGTKFSTEKELLEYIKENMTVEIDYDYRESGRTKISIIYNLNEIKWPTTLKNKMMKIGVVLNTEIPYDSISEYGAKYINYVYTMWNNQEYDYNYTNNYDYQYHVTKDEGYSDSLARDIDNDGDTTEQLAYAFNTLNITHAVASKQSVIQQIRTDRTNGAFISDKAEVNVGGNYTYKLKVTTGANSLKDLIIYDTLETIVDESGNEISSGWKGKLLNVDTSYAMSKGYAPKVYYSEEKNPGKLTEVPERWMELTDEVDKTTVKSICVDLRYKEDGSEMALSSSNVVFVLINMQASEDDTIISSANNMFKTNWRAIDPKGEIIDNVEGIYSNQLNVNIYKLENVKKVITGKKTWKDDWQYMSYRPKSITVKLLQDGIEYMRREVTEEDSVGSYKEEWNYTFEDVPVYKNDKLEEYEYSVEEVEVPMYETIYDGYNITNKLKTVDMEIEKIWDDNEKGLRPLHLLIRVYDGEKIVDATWLDGCNEYFGLKKTISLPMYREDGSKIEYRIDEEVPKNLDFYVSGEWITDPNFSTEDGLDQYNKHYVKKIDGYTVTNKYIDKDEKIKITGQKIWEDNDNKALKRPDNVILQIKEGEEVVSEGIASQSTNWSCEFEVLKYDELGNERSYYIDERTTPKFYEKELTNDLTVTNKFKVPDEKVKILAVKLWEDFNDKYEKRPKSVVLQVFNKDGLVAEKKVTDRDNFRYEFEVPRYDDLGNEIEYRVDEKYTDENYEKRISGYTVINKCIYEPEVDTSDINVFVYVIIFCISIIGIVYSIILKNNKQMVSDKK